MIGNLTDIIYFFRYRFETTNELYMFSGNCLGVLSRVRVNIISYVSLQDPIGGNWLSQIGWFIRDS